jgi:hypothetical protein
MSLAMNADFANQELSLEELEAIAAGWPHWLHTAVNFVEHEVSAGYKWTQSPQGKTDIGYITTGISIAKTIFSFF